MGDEPIVRLLSTALTAALDELHAGMAAAGHPALRPIDGYALNAILNGRVTASAIAPRLGMTKQGVAKVLTGLAAEGYVAAGEDAEDARSKPFRLTARGRDAVALSVRLQDELEARWAELSGARRLASTRAALEDLAGEGPIGGFAYRPGVGD